MLIVYISPPGFKDLWLAQGTIQAARLSCKVLSAGKINPNLIFRSTTSIMDFNFSLIQNISVCRTRKGTSGAHIDISRAGFPLTTHKVHLFAFQFAELDNITGFGKQSKRAGKK